MKWEDPPVTARKYNSKRWAAEAAELRANPGQWALLTQYPETEGGKARNLAWQIKAGRLKAFQPRGAFGATSREAAVYVRFQDTENFRVTEHNDGQHSNDWDMKCPLCGIEMTEVLKEEDENE